jgi:hypothetical protein
LQGVSPAGCPAHATGTEHLSHRWQRCELHCNLNRGMGQLTLQTLQLPIAGASTVTVTRDSEAIQATVSPEGATRFAMPLTLKNNEVLQLHTGRA